MFRELFNFILNINSIKILLCKIFQTILFDFFFKIIILYKTKKLQLCFKIFFNYLYSINKESELWTNKSVPGVSRVQVQPNILPRTNLTQLRNIVKGTACSGTDSTTDLIRRMFSSWILWTAHGKYFGGMTKDVIVYSTT